MNERQEKLLRVMKQLSPKAPSLYKNKFGWNLVYGFGTSQGACSANYVSDNDVEELKQNGLIDEKLRLVKYGRENG